MRAKNIHPTTHTRLPRYVRGHVGTVERIHGCHVFPDSAATEAGEDPQWLYTVVFDGARAMGAGCRSDAEDLGRRLRALSGAGVMRSTRRRARAAGAVPSIPRDAEGPVFREPWEAQAFAMALALHERGLFTWREWAATLADEIKRAQAAGDPDTGETYYRHWLATRWNDWSRKRASPRRRPCIATAMPGTMPPTARRTARQSNCGRRISARR